MSTQHPDNVAIPHFSNNTCMTGDEEIHEAFHSFSTLGIDEQLWDAEGKEVDNFVVKKLLSRHSVFFKDKKLGKDKFITLRVPNPEIEKDEGKILLEALHSIPRNFDIGKKFYNSEIPPLFEVVLPMCSSEKGIIRIQEYYKNFIIKAQHKRIYNHDLTIAQWLGKLQPDSIRVTPLFETKEAILNADKYVEKYIKYEKIKEMQRVWFARSDPALNYGSTSTVLLNKIALMKLHLLQEKLSVDILPILGCGTAPFRGNFKPTSVEAMMKGYPSVQTFTAQSAFKYDFPEKEVIAGVEKINSTKRKDPLPIDFNSSLKLIEKMEKDYQQSIKLVVSKINMISPYVPQRRKRKLHIDLFGYARQQGKIQLPRAINFCASLYSLGLPPDILGLSVLKQSDLELIREGYKNIDLDVSEALHYLNKDNLSFFGPEIEKRVLKAAELFDFEVHEEHKAVTSTILLALKKHDKLAVEEGILAAGRIRRFLG